MQLYYQKLWPKRGFGRWQRESGRGSWRSRDQTEVKAWLWKRRGRGCRVFEMGVFEDIVNYGPLLLTF